MWDPLGPWPDVKRAVMLASPALILCALIMLLALGSGRWRGAHRRQRGQGRLPLERRVL
jgi:hypothetical protein